MANRGTCAFCGEEKVLNSKGLCTSCKNVVPCAVHPDLFTAQRCNVCRKPACAYCILQGVCESCRAEGRSAAKEARGKPTAKAAVSDEEKLQRQRLMKLAGVLAVAGVANWWYFYGTPTPPDQLVMKRVESVHDAIMAVYTRHGRMPKTAKDIYAAGKEAAVPVPLILPQGVRHVPNAVIYAFDGKAYQLYATTDTGQEFKFRGKPYMVTVP